MSLLDIKPHVVSKSLEGYSVMLYGDPKSGKTYNATRFKKPILLAFEIGFNAIPGVIAKPLNSWSEFKKVLRELKTPEVKEAFSTVIIDTVDIAYDLCEKHICNINGVTSIGDIPFGGGYGMVAKEFDEALRAIVQMGYGEVLISHAVDKTFTDESGKEFNQIVPTLPKKAATICSRLTDIIGYSRAVDTDAGTKMKLFLRGTPRFVAGSRFKYIDEVIDFTYEALVDAIADAVDKQMKATNDDSLFTDERGENSYIDKTLDLDFDEVMEKFKSITSKMMDEEPAYYADRIVEVVEKHLGAGKKVADCTRGQVAIVDLIVYDLEQLIKEKDK